MGTFPQFSTDTSVKNEEGCRDDIVPKTGEEEGTVRWIEGMQTIFRNPQKPRYREGFLDILSIHLGVPSCFNSFWHSVIHTCFFIFTLVSQQCIGIGNDTVGKQRRSYMQPPEVYTEKDQRASFVRSAAAVRPPAPPAARADTLGHAHSNGDV